jgi:UDP-N-acetylglucosamine acyltransferase
MSTPQSCRIHPTAILSPETELGEGVEIGPYVVTEGKVKIGPQCVIKPHVYLVGNLTLGRGNVVGAGSVLGEKPQHLRYNNEATSVEIGDNNIFREHVTVHRATTHSWVTRIGNHNFFMAASHVAHDCVVGNRCIFANGALLGGHCQLADNVIISGNAAVHQFLRIGRLALLSGCSATTKDIPPFIIQQEHDTVVGVNVVGMRRAGMNSEQINGVRRAFRLLFREGLTLPVAIQHIETEVGHIDTVQEMLTFLKACPRGINAMRSRGRAAA